MLFESADRARVKGDVVDPHPSALLHVHHKPLLGAVRSLMLVMLTRPRDTVFC